MSRELKRLAARRATLVAHCAQQRAELANEFAALRAPLAFGGVRELFATHGKLKLALAGAALGLAVTRPKRLLALAAGGLSLARTFRRLLPLLPR